ncbi:kielin/chordin-like protein [Thrips palmi]|uniref:Kielin/chordin-like protein n=1 Tax=Thrips palmi TaxID=161013 RepID=A0A6P8Z6I9_THRPL|nr:kielin/chordin-like protein [Thrips palmi]
MAGKLVVLLPLALLALTGAPTGARAASTAKCGEGACSGLRHLHHYYEELGCTPITKEGECCPSSYDCGHMATRDKSRCYFKGAALDVRPDFELLDPSVCLAGCFCRQTKEANAVASLTCAQIECPSLFNPSLIPEGCVATYSMDKCCSDGVLCQQNTTAETAKCEWKGETYLEGQKFYPDEEPCKTCICKRGFDGTLNGPWCKEATCGLELHHTRDLARGCAPVFWKSTCCPIEWRCPAEDDVVVAAVTTKNPAPAEADAASCKWGSLTLRRGDGLSAPKSGGACETCRCDVPPHVTCNRGGEPCAAPEVAAPEAAAASEGVPVDAATGSTRTARSYTCANVRCVSKCVMKDGHPHCVGKE